MLTTVIMACMDVLNPAKSANPDGTRDIYTVSRLNREVRRLLETRLPVLWIEGEISNLARPGSGHWYFSLKDSTAQVRCAMFRQKNRLLNFAPTDGEHVLVRGRVGVYEPRGEYQLIIDFMEPAGEGALRLAFEQLKRRLDAEGLFALEHKRALPSLARRIGVITSPTGAAIRDILKVLRRRFPSIPVIIYPVQVQGASAAGQMVEALGAAARRAECDVLILTRGGGSLEDLWAFNEEALARAIFDCPIPVVSGVGHEVDITIADLVADLRAPTPSAAAELVVPDRNSLLQTLTELGKRIIAAVERALEKPTDNLAHLRRRLLLMHPAREIRQHSQRVDELEQRLANSARNTLNQKKTGLSAQIAHLRRLSPMHRVARWTASNDSLSRRLIVAMHRRLEVSSARFTLCARTLNAVSPLATLDRGYAIIQRAETEEVIRHATQLSPGEIVRGRLSTGRMKARIVEIETNEKRKPK